MICVGDGLNKNLVMNHLIWLLINGSQKQYAQKKYKYKSTFIIKKTIMVEIKL